MQVLQTTSIRPHPHSGADTIHRHGRTQSKPRGTPLGPERRDV
jgi:hypothetical protein